MKTAVEKIYSICFNRPESNFQEKLWLVMAVVCVFTGIGSMILAIS